MASIGTKKGTEKAQGGIKTASIADEQVSAKKIHPDVNAGEHFLYTGKGQPLLFLSDLSGVAAGTDAAECIAVLPGCGAHLYYKPIGTVSVAPYGPTADADGLDINLDLTNNEGVNYVVGGLLGPWLLTVKRDIADPIPKGMFIRWKGKIADVSGADDIAIGWRKNEAHQVNVDDYADLACLNVISGDVKKETIVGGAATVTVDTTLNWADGETHEIIVKCLGNGKVEFLFDGATPSTGAAYQFTEDLAVVPFIFITNDVTTPGKIHTVELEVGRINQMLTKPKW